MKDETTSQTISYALSYLASRPEMQEKIVEEYDRVIGKKVSIEYEDTKHMEYTMSVFKETLREIPVAIAIIKVAEEDTQLGEYSIPKGTLITIDTNNVHKNEKYWSNPEKFDPERFMRDQITPYSFIPFSVGPRSCIGMKFAETEAVVALSKIVRKFKVSHFGKGKDPHIRDCRIVVVLSPKVPIQLVFTPRD